MPILNPAHLLEQAERLLERRAGGRNPTLLVRQVDRRRAISAAYYAVFHFALAALADQFVGKAERTTVRYALAYRSVDHNKLEGLSKIARLEKIDKNSKYSKFVPEDGFGESIREFASLFLELKEKRNSADYDPSNWVKIVDARKAIASARSAIEQFENAQPDETIMFITLLAFPPR